MPHKDPEAARAYHQAYAAKNRERNAERARQWHKDNPERAAENKRAYYQANREKYLERARQYRTEHREKVNAYSLEYARTDPEKNRARVRAWAIANPERARIQSCETSQRRYARKKSAVIEPVSRVAVIARGKSICGLCHKHVAPKDMSLDHIIPISQGGAHAEWNLQVAHIICNKIKGTGRLPSQTRLHL